MLVSDSKMTVILDQKHYVEELNRHLSGTVTDLQSKMDSLEKTNSKLIEEVREHVYKKLSEMHDFLIGRKDDVCVMCSSQQLQTGSIP